MRIILGADHGGLQKKELVKKYLLEKGLETVDVGALNLEAEDDFVDYAKKAVEEKNGNDRVILFCRNGFGMCIVANRYKGVRCGIGFKTTAVEKGRLDDDINALSIPSDYVDDKELYGMVDVFLTTDFSDGDKYLRRISKIDQ